eukprot:TRINITY_DN5129_c0_g1_i2.p1 TRINITY_DN5129_c0_g1~~TRINITY_DN5129_c0_g1_i2.p1  ORF type:complete len:336 (-),score=63.41 TRINITY_DN5129_c0_g1_i2:863-1870(-)
MRRVYSRDDVSSHQSKEDGGVWVIYDGLVLDVTDFMHDHPGGDELITRFAGKDITAVYASDKYHMHSKTSLSILQSLVIGSVEGHSGGPLFGAVALSTANYAESSKFIDINLPIVPQLLNLKCSKEEYMLQIHRPRHCPQTARIFEWDCMELLTHTPWQAIPVVWGSLAVYMAYLALQTLTFNQFVPTLLGGVMTWSLIEYFVHRFVFHQESMVPAHPIFFTMHFLTHALHHFLPMEKNRLVMPIPLATPIAVFFFYFFSALLPHAFARAAYCGAVVGYICYDVGHFFLHHTPTNIQYFKNLKSYHLAHHYVDPNLGFGVSSHFWDRIFGTLLPM